MATEAATTDHHVSETLPAPARVNILGVGVSAVNIGSAMATMARWIEQRTPHYVCITGAHGVIESQKDERLREIHNQAGMVTPDGMPLVWLSRLRRQRQVDRVYGPDLMAAVCDGFRAQNCRHFLYGGGPGVGEKLGDALRAKYPGITIAGTYTPPFRALTDEEDADVVARINDAQADIVWVGLSTPKQEYWMAGHIGRITAPVMVGVGAAFDFHAGLKEQAPRWIQRSGFEWLFRLVTEPKRLWRRYAEIVPVFLFLVALESLGLRQRSLESEDTAKA